jgi:hypothetical protein
MPAAGFGCRQYTTWWLLVLMQPPELCLHLAGQLMLLWPALRPAAVATLLACLRPSTA